MTLTADDLIPALTRAQTAEVRRLIGEIDEFKGHWRRVAEVKAERLAHLKHVTTIESTASSTRIEGVELSDSEVARVLEGLHVDSFRARDESEVKGYADLLALIYESYDQLSLTENHLKQLHTVLLRHSGKDDRHRGEYKKLPNHVQATHPDGNIETLFQTAAPFDTPRLMAELVEVSSKTLEGAVEHPLVIIGRFIVEFLAIHPFQDGNGRLARAVTTLLLLRAGYDYVPYASIERVIEDNKQAYYAALRESQLRMRDQPAEFGAWLLFFLKVLQTQKRSLKAKLEVERSMLQLSDVQQHVVDYISSRGRTTSSEIGSQLTIPYRTVRYHLEVLVGRGLVEAHGEKRGRYYTRAIAPPAGAPAIASGQSTNAIVADIYELGGRINQRDLLRLVKRRGYDGRTVGILHGRRKAHLRKDPKTGESVLTGRGKEVAQEHLFAVRLAARNNPKDS